MGLAAATAAAQPNVEDQARRQLESGREVRPSRALRRGDKDFQTVAEGYPTSTVADDALLAVADYQLEIARDPISARSTADSLIKKYATADSAPMGTSSWGGRRSRSIKPPQGSTQRWRASIACRASFRRATPSRQPSTSAPRSIDVQIVHRAHSIGCDASRSNFRDRSGRPGQGSWESRLLVGAGQPKEALRALQRVIRRFPSSEEASTARAWNTILYRVYLRSSSGPAFTASGRTITGPAGRLRDVEALSLAPTANWVSPRARASSCSTRKARLPVRRHRASRASCNSIGRTG